MSEELSITDLRIVVAAESHNSSLLNPDWLIRRGVILEDWGWEQEHAPICTPTLSRVAYDSGVSIEIQPDHAIFTHRSEDFSPDDTRMPEIARRCVKQLPEVNYTAAGINPLGHIRTTSVEEARAYVKTHFLKDGPWHAFGNGLSSALIQVIYEYDRRRLGLTIEPGEHTASSGERYPAVLYRGNAHTALHGDTPDEKYKDLLRILKNWRVCYNEYIDAAKGYCLREE